MKRHEATKRDKREVIWITVYQVGIDEIMALPVTTDNPEAHKLLAQGRARIVTRQEAEKINAKAAQVAPHYVDEELTRAFNHIAQGAIK